MSTCVINGQVVELELLSPGEVAALGVEDELPTRGRGKSRQSQQQKQQQRQSQEQPSVDKYGFYIEFGDDEQFHKSLAVPEKVQRQRDAKDDERLKKWQAMRKAWGSRSVQGKVQERCRKGIPHPAREWAWALVCNAERFTSLFPSAPATPSLLPTASPDSAPSATTLEDIERDIPRTFPRHELFAVKEGAGQTALRRLLRCYAEYDPEVGYCQGMGFIAAMLLTVLKDERLALAAFIAALHGPPSPGAHALPFQLREMYLPSMSGAQRVLFVFEGLGRRHLGRLWLHLEAEGMHPSMYATEWLMTMFCRGFSFSLALRVWDCFLHSLDVKIVYRVALALLKNAEQELLSSPFEGIMGVLRGLPERTDAEAVMAMAWALPVTRGEIRRLEKEHAEQVAAGGV